MPSTIINEQDLAVGLHSFWEGAEPSSPQHQTFLSVLKGGRNFVCSSDRTRMAPSRFVGYLRNTLAMHSRLDGIDGGVTDKAISGILGEKVRDSLSEDAYGQICKSFDLVPPRHTRSYWILPKAHSAARVDGPTFFENDEEGYADYLVGHPSSFVGNMLKTLRPTYFVIHAATCPSITPASSRSGEPGAFTSRAYRKVTAERREEIVEWARSKGFVEPRDCSRCLVEINSPAEFEYLYPDEVTDAVTYPEGATRQVLVNAYERSDAARRDCLAAHGSRCCVCAFDFGEVFGELGAGFIHVHHLTELSLIRTGYLVDPVRDLRPICPNCHAMAHRTRPALSLEELKALRHGQCDS
jgi:hypothetical protein